MIKKITLNKIYLLIVFTCLFIFEYYGMMGMNMEDDVRVYTVIPNFLLCTAFMVYAFLHGNDLLKLPSVIKRFVLMYFGLFFLSIILNFSLPYKDLISFASATWIMPLGFIYSYIIFKEYDLDKLVFKLSFVLFSLLIINYFNIFLFLNTDSNYQSLITAYYPMFLLPFILSSTKNKLFKFLILGLSLFTIFTCMKRGCLIALILATAVYYLVDYLLVGRSKYKIVSVFVIVGVVLVVIFSFLKYDDMTGNQFTTRLESIEDDEGSGRIDVWLETIRLINNSDTAGILFGHGHLAVIRDSVLSLSAHNDFMEIFYNYGIFVFLLYCVFHISLIKLCFKLIKQKSSLAAPMAMSYVIFFTLTLISHIYFYPYFAFLLLFWGKALGTLEREKSLNTTNAIK